MATYSRYELDSMRRQFDEQINRNVDAYNERYPGDMVAPPIEYADLQSKIAEYYRECREIDRWGNELFAEAKETGWVYWTLMDNDAKLFAGINKNNSRKWKVERAGVVREFVSKDEALEWAKSPYWN